MVKERVGEGSRFCFDCTSQEKAVHGHVVYVMQEVSKTASKGAPNGSHCPGNERYDVNLASVTLWHRNLCGISNRM